MTPEETERLLPCRHCGAPPTAPLGQFCDEDSLHEFPVMGPYVIERAA